MRIIFIYYYIDELHFFISIFLFLFIDMSKMLRVFRYFVEKRSKPLFGYMRIYRIKLGTHNKTICRTEQRSNRLMLIIIIIR